MVGYAAISLSLLSLGPKRKVKCYNSSVCIKGSTFNEYKVDYYGRLGKRSSNCNIITSRIKCFYSNAIGMTQITEESE
jgi:hypothetical protein